MLESLETVLGESTITDKVKILLRRYRYRNFHFTQFLDLLKPYIVDKIDLSQVIIIIEIVENGNGLLLRMLESFLDL
jgi:hypothetical protein